MQSRTNMGIVSFNSPRLHGLPESRGENQRRLEGRSSSA
jgi:hypothetical protein